MERVCLHPREFQPPVGRPFLRLYHSRLSWPRLLCARRLKLPKSVLQRANKYLRRKQKRAPEMVQLQKLRELQLEDMTSKAAYQGYQVQKDADMVATEQQFFGPTVINPGDSRVFPTTP